MPKTAVLFQAYATGDMAIGGCEDGDIAGAEVAQLYVTFPDAANEPVRQLRGLKRSPSSLTKVKTSLSS